MLRNNFQFVLEMGQPEHFVEGCVVCLKEACNEKTDTFCIECMTWLLIHPPPSCVPCRMFFVSINGF